jgi:formamidopyrimidine-DNA glycosylase
MPELPEVETVVRELKVLEGLEIIRGEVFWDRSIEGSTQHFLNAIKNACVTQVTRRGKYIVMATNREITLTIHLRMTGKLVFEPQAKDLPYVRVRLDFKNGTNLSFVDIRKFGRWKMWPQSEPLLPLLGLEPLDKKSVLRALDQLKTSREIKKVLLDQSFLAGVGNIYADEACFAARIHPSTPAHLLAPAQIEALGEAIPKILKASIKNMGTTLSDYRNTKNVGGENQHYLKVYGQAGKPCKNCATPIEKLTIGQRTTHFCPDCQKV